MKLDLTDRRVYRSHWRLIGVIGILSAIVAFAASYLWTPQYSSAAHILVRGQEARFLNNKGQDLTQQPNVIDASLVAPVNDTLTSMVGSRALAEDVVRDLKLDHRAGPQGFWAQARSSAKTAYKATKDVLIHGEYKQPAAHEAAVLEVQGALTATPVKDSYVIEIKATADNPQLAAAIANSATTNLIAMMRERDSKDATAYAAFLKDQLDRTSADVQAAEAAVQKYKQDNNLTDINEQLQLDAQSDQNLRDQLRDAKVQLAAAQAERDAISAQLASVSPTLQTTSTVTTGRSSTTMTNTDANTVYSQLKAKLATLDGTIASLQAKQDSITALLTPSSKNPLPQQEAQLRVLDLQLTSANDAYKQVRSAYESALTNSQESTALASQFDNAAPPLYPDKPLRYLYLLIGLLLGLIGGGGLAHWRWHRAREIDLPVELAPVRKPSLAPQPAFSVTTGEIAAPPARVQRLRK